MTATSGSDTPAYIVVSALDAGHITLPETLFVTDADPDLRATVPSLSFLIQHQPSSLTTDKDQKTTRIVFDLGVKRDLTGYREMQLAHVAQRQPIITDPDCANSLRKGDPNSRALDGNSGQQLLDPGKDIDFVILSHVHWDHVGTPSDFKNATFIVGSGTLDILKNGAGPLYPAELFNQNELPRLRTVELPPVKRHHSNEYNDTPHAPKHTDTPAQSVANLPQSASQWAWQPLSVFPNALNFFGDGSLFVIDSPGHLYGHVNLLARLSEDRYLYLGGDCCHDPRILSGEKNIAMYDDGRGGMRSVHVHTETARATLDNISSFLGDRGGGNVQIEVVLAHDKAWREKNRHRFWPGTL
ncbi:hypothetical protein B0J15DRAFT_592313 [Fusarium solani]|uniref:Metallo-beta-lactamase domain-containing protein n=1 Tax=Fusarium solani TaxID=169388 RepID=A0A9P9HYA1_FUSSL|nr:uncharacterized protein B0J15DRAFT_592313 [Fusarium solani]KAH7265760.1 hypothetical protein B0J15DRAFT_592313 [Fusarium solani]